MHSLSNLSISLEAGYSLFAVSYHKRDNMAGVSPVFFIAGEEYLTNYEVCYAAEVEGGEGGVIGAQAIGKLWRIYPATSANRITMLMKGRLVIRGESYNLT